VGAFHTYLNTSQTRYNRTLLHRFFAGYKKFPDVTSVQEAMNLNYEKKKYIQVQKYMYKYKYSLGTRMGGSQHIVIKQRFSIGCRMFNQIWRQQLRFTSTRTSRVTLCECETWYSWVSTEILTQMFVRTAQPLQKLRLRSGNAKEARTDPQISTRDVLIVGDLTLTVSVIWEITHPSLFHQHNADSGKTYIDRITANTTGFSCEDIRWVVEQAVEK